VLLVEEAFFFGDDYDLIEAALFCRKFGFNPVEEFAKFGAVVRVLPVGAEDKDHDPVTVATGGLAHGIKAHILKKLHVANDTIFVKDGHLSVAGKAAGGKSEAAVREVRIDNDTNNGLWGKDLRLPGGRH
jgi:hypothetical protein